jgi:exosortase/archaeosortase
MLQTLKTTALLHENSINTAAVRKTIVWLKVCMNSYLCGSFCVIARYSLYLIFFGMMSARQKTELLGSFFNYCEYSTFNTLARGYILDTTFELKTVFNLFISCASIQPQCIFQT